MSTRTGTLQAPRAGRAFWMPALLTVCVAAAFTVAAIAIGADEGRDDAGTNVSQGTVEAVAGDHGGGARRVAGSIRSPHGTLANTPTELRGGVAVTSFGGTLANTPTELSGGMSFGEPYEPIVVSQRVCGQCR